MLVEESGQWFENVDQTQLVLASGEPVLQKKITSGTRISDSSVFVIRVKCISVGEEGERKRKRK